MAGESSLDRELRLEQARQAAEAAREEAERRAEAHAQRYQTQLARTRSLIGQLCQWEDLGRELRRFLERHADIRLPTLTEEDQQEAWRLLLSVRERLEAPRP